MREVGMPVLRRAEERDVAFMARVDLEVDDGIFSYTVDWDEGDFEAHREKMRRFLFDPDKAAWVIDDPNTGSPAALAMCLFRHCRPGHEPYPSDEVLFPLIEAACPGNVLFCEVFQLWVAPERRRQGWSTLLKQEMEREARRRGCRLIYTHTAAFKQHVIDLNMKLGYRKIRRGPLFGDAACDMVSLVKVLT